MLPEDITQAVLTSTTFLTVWGVQTPMLVILPTDFKGGMAMTVRATEQDADSKEADSKEVEILMSALSRCLKYDTHICYVGVRPTIFLASSAGTSSSISTRLKIQA